MSVQRGWRRCGRCAELYYAGVPGSCPAGGGHQDMGFGLLPFTSKTDGAQEGWRWCKRCGAMFYSGLGAGRCTNGSGHDATGSGQYSIGVGAFSGMATGLWRWCRNCQVLFRRSEVNVCAAANGGLHDSEGSGDYWVRYQPLNAGVAVAFEGAGNSGELWLNVRHGGNSYAPVRVPAGVSGTPSIVNHDGKLFLFYQGMGGCKELWMSTFDGVDFSSSRRIGDVRLSGSPSVIVTSGGLEVFLQGTSRDVNLWQIKLSNDGVPTYQNNYNGQLKVWNDPGAVAVPYGNSQARWVFFEPANGDRNGGTGELQLFSHRGLVGPLPKTRSKGSPAAVYFRDHVYVFHEDERGQGHIYYHRIHPGATYDDAATFSEDRRIPNVLSSGVPAPVVDNDMLYVFHEGHGDNGQLWYVSTRDGDNWSADQRAGSMGVSRGAAACRFQLPP